MKQVARVLAYCDKHGSISQAEALRIGVGSLSRRICDIIELGFDVQKERIDYEGAYGRSHYTRYYIKNAAPAATGTARLQVKPKRISKGILLPGKEFVNGS